MLEAATDEEQRPAVVRVVGIGGAVLTFGLFKPECSWLHPAWTLFGPPSSAWQCITLNFSTPKTTPRLHHWLEV